MRIESLVPSQKGKGLWHLTFSDGSTLKLTDREVADFSLRAGAELPPDTLARLRDSAGESGARRRAVNILSVRAMSRRQLEQRLLEKGETPAHAASACDYMEHLGYLDDHAYALDLAGHYSARGYGPRKVQEELYRRGVPREFWEEALAGPEEPEDTLDQLVRAKLRRVEHPDRKDLKRVSDALLRRGYPWSDVSAAIRRYTDELDEEGCP